MFQVPGYYSESVLKGRCADPDIFNSDRLALRFERRQQVSCTNSFGLTKGENVDAAQNLACNSFPEARTVIDASRSVTKLGDADG